MTDAAFERVVREHGDSLVRVAWGYVGNAADHDDLVQDILVAIWYALPRFRGESSERTFVFRIAHNRGCAFLARRARGAVHEELTDDSPVADPLPGPAERLESAVTRDRLAAAIRTLPQQQRQAVLLHLEGFDVAEIAELQTTTPNNVSVRLNRARARLRALLGGAK